MIFHFQCSTDGNPLNLNIIPNEVNCLCNQPCGAFCPGIPSDPSPNGCSTCFVLGCNNYDGIVDYFTDLFPDGSCNQSGNFQCDYTAPNGNSATVTLLWCADGNPSPTLQIITEIPDVSSGAEGTDLTSECYTENPLLPEVVSIVPAGPTANPTASPAFPLGVAGF